MAVYPICKPCATRREKCAMPSAHRKDVRWKADVQFGFGGKRLRKTFDQKSDADAQERAWYTDHGRGKMPLLGEVGAHLPFAQVADEWAAMAQNRGIIKNFGGGEKSRVEMFKTAWAERAIGSLTLKDGDAWMNGRLSKGRAIGTINRDMKTLNFIMDYAVAQKYISANPFEELKELKGSNVHDRWMSEAEVSKLLAAAAELGDFDLVDVIAIGVNTGFRKGNLERLCARDIFDGEICARMTKSGKPYSVPIAPDVIPTLKRLLEANPTKPVLNTIKLDKRFRAASKKAGLYIKKGNMENVTIHTLRHTFAVLYLKRSNYNLYKLSQLMGHASSAITERNYARFCKKDFAKQAPLISTPIVLPAVVPQVTLQEPRDIPS